MGRWGGIKRLVRNIGRLEESIRAALFARDYIAYRQQGVELSAVMAMFWTGRSKLQTVRLGDLFVVQRQEPRIVPLAESLPTKFLMTGEIGFWMQFAQGLPDYSRLTKEQMMDKSRYLLSLRDALKTGYEVGKMAIAVDQKNVIIDGNRRASCLLDLFGADHEIQVVKMECRA